MAQEREEWDIRKFNGSKCFHFSTRNVLLRYFYNTHWKKSMVVLTNKNGYLSCTFVLSTLGTEHRYKECARCVEYHPGATEQ